MQQLEQLILRDLPAATQALAELTEALRAQPDAELEVYLEILQAICELHCGDYPAALKRYHAALERARQLGRTDYAARCLNGLGLVHFQLDNYGTAMGFQLENLSLTQATGDRVGQLRALVNIGLLHDRLGELEQGMRYHRRALALARELGTAAFLSNCLLNIGDNHCAADRIEAAFASYRQALEHARRQGNRMLEGKVLASLAQLQLRLKRYATALTLCQRALKLIRQVGDRDSECQLELTRGAALAALDEPARARAALERALALASAIGARRHRAQAHAQLSEFYEKQRDYRAALAHARAHQALERERQLEELERKTRFLTAQLEAERLRHEIELERLKNAELKRLNRELEAAKQKLAHQAAHDPLTGLANRAQLEQHLAALLAREAPFALLFIDLDNFKEVNDRLGHHVGDLLLKEIAARLKAGVRQHDLVARSGGDEFVLILSDIAGVDTCAAVARKLLQLITMPLFAEGQQLRISASIGIARYPEDGRDAASLRRHADVAMYRAKHRGKNGLDFGR